MRLFYAKSLKVLQTTYGMARIAPEGALSAVVCSGESELKQQQQKNANEK